MNKVEQFLLDSNELLDSLTDHQLIQSMLNEFLELSELLCKYDS